jgi:dienelactone hydrolase
MLLTSSRPMRRTGSTVATVATVATAVLAALALLVAAPSSPLAAAIVATPVPYQSAGATCDGELVTDDAWSQPHPGVLVVHDWMSITPRTESAAHRLAELGYAAFVVDVYGHGVRPSSIAQAGPLATRYKGDRPLMRQRMNDALAAALATGKIDSAHVGAIGYCFGGTCVLELARSGAPIAATVTFHGGLDTPTPQDDAHIRGSVLVLHGADDPYVNHDEVERFVAAMRATTVDWQLVMYSHAVHGFTDPTAPTDPSHGYAYNPLAAQRSWQAMSDFFRAQLGSTP